MQLLNCKAATVKNIIYTFDHKLQPAFIGENEFEDDYKFTSVFNIEVADWHTYFVR